MTKRKVVPLLRAVPEGRGAAVDDRLVRAASRLFREKGFAATTVREIAKAAGMLPGSLHYRYPTKAALLLALMKRGVEADIACVRSAIAGSRDPMERLRLALRARVRYLLSRDVASVVLYDWRSLKGRPREEMIRLRDHYEAFWTGLLYEAEGAGHLRPGVDVNMLRFLIFGATNWVTMWYSPDGTLTPEQIADAFWELIGFGAVDDSHREGDHVAGRSPLTMLDPSEAG
jgi:TetR/AcrR family transcriptional regulator, cholesterol catabolism regulator